MKRMNTGTIGVTCRNLLLLQAKGPLSFAQLRRVTLNLLAREFVLGEQNDRHDAFIENDYLLL